MEIGEWMFYHANAKMKTVSVIVPIYNVEVCLRKCLDSLYAQVDDTIEVILVNDGSTDSSPEICQEYISRYPSTIYVDKENGGLSDARNAGTKVASGKYVYYLDSDDWLASDTIRTLYAFAEANNCEVVQGGFYYAYEGHLLFDNRYKTPLVLDRYGAMLQLIRNDYVKNFAWGKLYKTEIVKQHQFPKGKFYEDSYWQHLVMHDITWYGIVPTPLYYYRQRNTGISGAFSLKNLDLLIGYEERLEFIQISYPEYTAEMVSSYYKVLSQYVQCAMQMQNEEVRQTFLHYQQETMEKYGPMFDAVLKHSLGYRIQHDIPIIYPAYSFVERIYNRFCTHSLTKVEIDKK